MFKSVKIIFFLLICIVLISSSVIANAPTALPVDQNLYNATNLVGRVDRAVIVPKKVSFPTQISDEKIAKELIYYFLRNGVQGKSLNYILFPSGQYFEIDKAFQKSLTKTNLSSKEVIILWLYRGTFDINNSTQNDALKTIIKKVIPNSDLNDSNSIEIRDIGLKVDNNSTFIEFGNTLDETDELRENLKTIDYKKNISSFKANGFKQNPEFPPNVIADLEFTFENLSDFDAYLGDSMSLSLKTEGDSQFFVSDSWQNTRTPLFDDSSFIQSSSSRTYTVKIKTPILPGEYKENIIAQVNSEKIESHELKFKVKDIGQKVLRIRGGIEFLNVRKDPNSSSPEIGRASPGAVYLFTEAKNNFHLIDFNGKQGWVSSRFVDIVKAK